MQTAATDDGRGIRNPHRSSRRRGCRHVGARLTGYNTWLTGPREAGHVDGPEEFHLVIVDNGRSEVLALSLIHICHTNPGQWRCHEYGIRHIFPIISTTSAFSQQLITHNAVIIQ